MQKNYFYFFILCLGLVWYFTSETNLFTTHPRFQISPEQDEKVVEYAKKLPQKGILKAGRDGYVYLKVDDDYIRKLFPLTEFPGYEMSAHFRRKDSPGAHISVFYVEEKQRTGWISEVGQVYTFKPTHLAFVPDRTQKYLVLQVDSPQLEELRKKYGLSPYLKGHSFHITIAKKMD